MLRQTQRTRYFIGAALVGALLATPFMASAGAQDPDFEKVSDGAIGEFRGNGDNTSWSIATGTNTQSSSDMDEAGFNWSAGTAYDWAFNVNGDGVSTLQVFANDDIAASVQYDGLTAAQMAANTLEVHAKRDVDITVDEYFDLSGNEADAFGEDFGYIGLAGGLTNFSISGSITFREPIENQAYSGVTFKAGNTPSSVPAPAGLGLLAIGLVGLLAARRRA